MKRILFFLFTIACVSIAQAQQVFEIKPAKPVAGSTIAFELLTRNTALQGKQDIECVAYLLEGKLPLAVPVQLTKDGGILSGSVKTNDSTKAVFFSFSKEDIIENNNDEGFYTILYDTKGKEVMGGNLALAQAFSNYGGIWQLKRSMEKATPFFEKEFASAAAREKYMMDYASWLAQPQNLGNKERLQQQLAKLSAKKDISEDDLSLVRYYYENMLKDKGKADELTTEIRQRFPNGRWKKTEAFQAFNKEQNVMQKEKLYNQFMKDFPPAAKEDYSMTDNLAAQLVQAFEKAENYEAVKTYAAMIHSNSVRANLFNSIAWRQAGEGINNQPKNVELGKTLSLQSLDLLKKEMKERTNKPSYYTEQEYIRNLEGSYNMYADTYATLLYHAGEYDKAYEIEKAAVMHFKRKNIDMNEAFAVLTEKTKGKEAAREELEQFFEDGRYSTAMKEQLKKIYLSGGKTEDDWLKYAGGLEEMAFNKMKAELAKEMLNKPAPLFSLKDTEGKEVSLASLKGKVVVVDFWATWCGPCIASFPAMKLAVEKFKNNPDVVFLFVDTWENGDDREKKVTDFIAAHKYPFRVLYDPAKEKEGNACVYVEKFDVDGIPTKFVIDRNGTIRFKSVGWGGSVDGLVNELSAMIDMAASESGEALKKTF